MKKQHQKIAFGLLAGLVLGVLIGTQISSSLHLKGMLSGDESSDNAINDPGTTDSISSAAEALSCDDPCFELNTDGSACVPKMPAPPECSGTSSSSSSKDRHRECTDSNNACLQTCYDQYGENDAAKPCTDECLDVDKTCHEQAKKDDCGDEATQCYNNCDTVSAGAAWCYNDCQHNYDKCVL